MANHKLPADWNIDPLMIIRDPEWEHNYPKLVLRGIYDVMHRYREKGQGSLMECYIRGFNYIIMGLVKAEPPRLLLGHIQKGILHKDSVLTGEGHTREAEVTGRREMRKATKDAVGLKSSPIEMQKDTAIKMKKLRIYIDELKKSLPDNTPDQSPTERAER